MVTLTITDIDAVTYSAERWAVEYGEYLSSGHGDAPLVLAMWEGWLEGIQCSVLRAYARNAFARELKYLMSF